MAHWQCISGCGACCRLDPAQRGDDLDCLSPDQRSIYLAMVGEDGWCIHFDTGGRRCRIYDARPDFCRVENLVGLFAGEAMAADEAGRRRSSVDAASTLVPTSAEPHRQAAEESVDGSVPRRGGALDAAAQALAIASCRTQIRAEHGGRGRVMRRFEQAIRRQP